MYSPYCLTQVNRLILFHCLGGLVRDAGFYCASSLCSCPCVYLLCLSVFLFVSRSEMSPCRLGARLCRRKLCCAFPSHMVLERKWRFSRNVFHIKKKEGSRAGGGESRAQGQAGCGADFHVQGWEVFSECRGSQEVLAGEEGARRRLSSCFHVELRAGRARHWS